MCVINENVFVENLVKGFAHAPVQLNKLQESDAELVCLNDNITLALTTDSIVEEIDLGLYDDPYQIGWMLVTASISDLCAVGAKPLGILICQTFKNDSTKQYIEVLQHGISDACGIYKTYVFGGDSNFSNKMNMCATAIGLVENNKPMMRTGCRVGDILYVSGKVGYGNKYAFSKLSGLSSEYKPVAKVEEGQIIHKYATACMDSSDGLFATLNQLMQVNQLGFQISSTYEEYLEWDSAKLCEKQNFPKWFMLAGPHGEYELVFTVSSEHESLFLEASQKIDWNPLKLGKVTKEKEIKFNHNNEIRVIDTTCIRNLFMGFDSNLSLYINELMKIENNWRMS